MSFRACVIKNGTELLALKRLFIVPFGKTVPETGANALNTFEPSKAIILAMPPPFENPVKKGIKWT